MASARRDLYHVEIQQTALFGNSTHLQYFYASVHIGSQRQEQALIVDTGSSIAALPCADYCSTDSATGKSTCGKHINALYDLDRSKSHHIYDCKREADQHCQCSTDGKDRCEFDQGYMEGSSYQGFMVTDRVYFGDRWGPGDEGITFAFGCIYRETKLFFTQKADGIMGMGKGTQIYVKDQVPIYRAMYEQKLVPFLMFSICLGIDGGFLQIGGYHLDEQDQ